MVRIVALLVVMLHAGEERGAPAVTTGDLLLQPAVKQRLKPVQLRCVTQPGPAGGRALTRDREPMVIVSSIQAPQSTGTVLPCPASTHGQFTMGVTLRTLKLIET